jgi:hypothetical protein
VSPFFGSPGFQTRTVLRPEMSQSLFSTWESRNPAGIRPGVGLSKSYCFFCGLGNPQSRESEGVGLSQVRYSQYSTLESRSPRESGFPNPDNFSTFEKTLCPCNLKKNTIAASCHITSNPGSGTRLLSH